MNEEYEKLAQQYLGSSFDAISKQEKNVITKIADRIHVSQNTNKTFDSQLTFGQRLADQVASFGGSWTFIIIFLLSILVWIITNVFILSKIGKAFDPYPFILLNLFLSLLASIQAPIIMMSQNRQTARDRLDATHDYEVNLKSELQIIDLHHKLDKLRDNQWKDLLEIQQKQIELLQRIINEKREK